MYIFWPRTFVVRQPEARARTAEAVHDHYRGPRVLRVKVLRHLRLVLPAVHPPVATLPRRLFTALMTVTSLQRYVTVCFLFLLCIPVDLQHTCYVTDYFISLAQRGAAQGSGQPSRPRQFFPLTVHASLPVLDKVFPAF